MKKPNNSKQSPLKKSDKTKDSGELRKPTKLKPLKEKEKKSWKNNLDDEEEDFAMEEDVKFESNFDEEEEEEGFFDDESF